MSQKLSRDKLFLHVMSASLFNDMALRMFEKAMPGRHHYLVFGGTKKSLSPVYDRCSRPQDIIDCIQGSNIKGIIFHGLPRKMQSVVGKIPKHIRVVWIGWGFDYYPLIHAYRHEALILPKTFSCLPLKERLKKKITPYAMRFFDKARSVREVLQRIDYFAPVLDVEFAALKKKHKFDAKYIEWNYGIAEDDYVCNLSSIKKGRNVLVGNSATATNNHIELFELIHAQMDLQGRRIIVPLVYGSPTYRDLVLKKGKRLFGDKFFGLTKQLSQSRYRELVNSCDTVAMNHLRQQAVSNILIALLQKSEVFLNKESPLFAWFKERNIVVRPNQALGSKKSTEESLEKNKTFVLSWWGRKNQITKTRKMLDRVLS